MRQRLIVLIGILVIILVIFTLLRPKPKSKVTFLTREVKPKIKKETLALLPKKEISGTVIPKLTKPIKKESLVVEKTETKKETLKFALIKPKEVAEDTETWGEDPFVREFSYISEMKSLIVSAITVSENEAYAIVNNQIVHVGDVIDGKKVVAIEKDRIVVEKGGKRFTIFLGE
jgi:type II secretory pathway component PulC